MHCASRSKSQITSIRAKNPNVQPARTYPTPRMKRPNVEVDDPNG
jgi:hypothetical protein